MSQQFIFNRFRRNIVPRTQNNQILDAPHDTPIPCLVNFSLVAGVKPTVSQSLGGLFWTLPITGKNIWTPNDNLLALAQLHFNSADRRPNPSRFDMAWVIHRANGSCLGQAINLQHRYSEHHEIKLRLHIQRSRAANQRFQIRADHLLANGRKDQGPRHT